MALYTRESKDRVRDAVDFVELVSARTELRRAGPARYEGLCPFHDERSPSFGIDPGQKVYHCFGCQASGDVFTFVQETEGVDFKGALELLADRFGVELQREEEDPKEAERRRGRERLLELLTRTAAYYERCLWESEEARAARDYLEARGLGEEILREFHVGYSPSAWDRVLLASRRGGFSEQELYATGLAQRSKENGRPYDRFRGRIMFPLADVRGRVLGFGARAMRDEQRGGWGPKYLNTSDNDVYHKGQHLYGADLARAHAARAGQAILCEGYTDVIALHQAGLRNTVGSMGTALTAEQVGELSRMAQTVLLALDADSAGQEAMLKAAGLAAKRKLELRVVALPQGTDPADLVQRDGADAINAAVEQAVPFVRFRVERVLASGDHGSPEGRDRMVEELRPVFAMLPPSAMRLELTRLVSGRLALPESLMETLLAPQAGKGPGQQQGNGPRPGQARRRETGDATPARADGLSRREETERTFLALCIASPEEGEQALGSLEVEEHFTSGLLQRAARHLGAGHLRDPMADPGGSEDGLDGDPQLKGLLAELVVEAGREPVRTTMLDVQRLQLELARVDRRIQQARGRESGDVSELAVQRGEVKLEFDRAQERAMEESGAESG
ncbi:MAG TPA: DNA primase [Solirubrobacteraceae bacterium]|nr:DNA primase [Solirubrobacteraceae bacterium]